MPVRFRLSIAYDGTDFHGWGVQPELRTVQGVLEAAIAKVLTRLGEKPRLVVAGRTDTGVHATGQVAHCDLSDEAVALLQQQSLRRSPVAVERAIPESAGTAEAAAAQLTHRLRGALSASPDVVVTEVVVAPKGFDARFSALWRQYEYRIADAVKVRDPLQRARTLWWGSTLDVEAMDTAAMSFLGLHDFAAFCRPRIGATTIRTMLEFRWRRDQDGTVVGSLRADAFCHSMVRSMVGASIEVGTGQLDGGDVTRILGETSRSAEFKVMAAKGLTLLEVAYPDDHALAARAELTRGLRVRS